MTKIESDLDRIFRSESGKLIAGLASYCQDIDLAEDSLQDAILQAVEQWKISLPKNKVAWLFTVAKRRMIDRIRRTKHHNKEQTLQQIIDTLPEQSELLDCEENQNIPDERLKLIFTCCHPALSEDAQIALTLKTLCGLKVKEIARAFLVSEVAMNQRITRAKNKIKLAGIAYKVPDKEHFSERLGSVLSVIYLIFNESYSAFEGQSLTKNELAEEAIRLARLLVKLLPKENVYGLMSLMLFHHSRRFARSTNLKPFIPLEFQDRKLWQQELITEADQLLEIAMSFAKPESYQIQAAISSLHSNSKSWQETDWRQILLLYKSLLRLTDNPVIKLNYYVAIAYSGELDRALNGVISLQKSLPNYQPFHVAKAYINFKLGFKKQAKIDYNLALKLTKNNIQRDYLMTQMMDCD